MTFARARRFSSLLPRSALGAGAAMRRGGHGGEFYEPTGHFLGHKPLPNGQRRQKEWWENAYLYGVGGSFVFLAVGLYFKPDTQYATLSFWSTCNNALLVGIYMAYLVQLSELHHGRGRKLNADWPNAVSPPNNYSHPLHKIGNLKYNSQMLS